MEHVVERGLIRRSYRYIPHLCGVFFNAQKTPYAGIQHTGFSISSISEPAGIRGDDGAVDEA